MRLFGRAFLALIILILTLGFLGAGIFTALEMRANAPKPVKRPARERTWQVETVRLKQQDIPITVEAFGTISAGRNLNIRSEIPGKLVFVDPKFKTGQMVSKGDLLFSVDPFRLEQDVTDAELALQTAEENISELRLQIANEEANRAQGKAAVTEAQDTYNRQKKLGDRGFVSPAAVQKAQTALANARRIDDAAGRTIDVLRNRVSQLEILKERATNALERVNRDLETSEYIAPFDGLVNQANLEIGQQVNTSEILASLIDPTQFEAVFRVPDRDLGQLINKETNGSAGNANLIGRSVKIEWTLGEQVLPFEAKVSRTAANVNATEGGLQVFASLENLPLQNPLRPGAFIKATLDAGKEKNIFAVPQTGVSPSGKLYFVGNGERVDVVDVALVRREGDKVLVRGDVPTDKDVIVNRFPQISKGVKVKVTSRDGQATDTPSTTVKMSEARRKEIVAGIEASPMPDFVKKRLIPNFSSEEVPREILENMRDRAGLVIPELDQGNSRAPTGTREGNRNRTGDGRRETSQGRAGRQGNGQRQAANQNGGDTVSLSKSSQAILLDAIKNSRMPDNRKGRIAERIETGSFDKERLQGLAGRLGVEIPELQEQPAQAEPAIDTTSSSASDVEGPATIELSAETRGAVRASIENSAAPDWIKQRLLSDLEKTLVPVEMLRNFSARSGVNIPELDQLEGSKN